MVATKPEGLFFVTDTGFRIPFDVKLWKIIAGTTYWAPIVEADISALMPSVVRVEGTSFPGQSALIFIDADESWDNEEWATRLITNSPLLFPGYTYESGRS